MKRISTIVLLLSSIAMCTTTNAQGTNNDFEIDQEDLVYLFEKLGYSVFKFPVKQPKGQALDVVIEEYENGKIKKTQSLVELTEKTFEEAGIEIDIKERISAKKDSTYFHRFYAHKTDSLLTIDIKSHGVSLPVKFDIANLSTALTRARFETKEEITEKGMLRVNAKRPLLFFYANQDKNKPLFCPAGMPKEMVIKQFYYAVFVSILPAE